MADNVAVTAGTGTTVAADDIAGVYYQRVKNTWGADGTANDTDTASGKAMPVQLRSNGGLIPLGEPTDAKNTATDTTSVSAISILKQISASVQTAVAGSGTATAAQRVTLASDDPAVTTLSTITAQFPSSLGSKAAASSLGVTASTEDIARVGIITETAPASDTASSGMNGRLQRIAQRLTSLIALLPTALGSAAAASSLAVTLSTEDIARQGIITETAPASDTASSGLNGRLQRIAQRLTSVIALLPTALGAGGGLKIDGSGTALPVSGSLSIAAAGLNATVTHTRAANTNTYGAGDVLGPSGGGTAAMDFNLGAVSASCVEIRSVSLERDVTALISGETSYTLHLYNVTPPSALADEATWDLPSGDRASYLGSINLGTPVDLGSTLYCQLDGVGKMIKLSGTHVFGYLVTTGSYVAASGSVLKVTMNAVQL